MGILNKGMALNIVWIYSSVFMRHSFEHLGFCCTQKKSTGSSHDTMQRKALWKECVCPCQGFSLLDTMIVVQHLVLRPLILIQEWVMKGWLPDSCHLEGREEILSFVKTHKKRFSSLTYSLSHLKCNLFVQIPVARQPELISFIFLLFAHCC